MKNTTPQTVILLCGGDINPSSLPIATSGSNAMIPVNGRPVIGWIIDDLLAKNISRLILITQRQNTQLVRFVEWAYKGRIAIDFAILEKKGNIIYSLKAGLQYLYSSQSVIVLLGDTLINEAFPSIGDWVTVTPKYEDSRNWCLAETDENNQILQYFDKQHITRNNLVAITGLYCFTNSSALERACDLALEAGGNELSHVLWQYGLYHSIKAIPCEQWYDFGHLPHFFKAKRELLQSRYFNQIHIESVSGILKKTSSRTEKLCDEYHWYLQLPSSLQVLTPRVLDHEESDGFFSLTLEYYGYPNLAEMYLYGNFNPDIWKTAIQNLFYTHLLMKSYTGLVTKENAWDMYWTKTNERIKELTQDNVFFRDILELKDIYWNGQRMKNIPRLWEFILACCQNLAETVTGSVIHGDFCLSNILYDLNNQIVRLIDPRGSFGVKGIYGDPRYDIAKLRHSLNGAYDFIVSDLFSLESESFGYFNSEICTTELHEELSTFFDNMLQESGYEIRHIIAIEALLFLSMIPLHKDKPKRQIMMYLRAIQLFNDLYEKTPCEL